MDNERRKIVYAAIIKKDFDGARRELNEVFKVDTNNALADQYCGQISYQLDDKNYEKNF